MSFDENHNDETESPQFNNSRRKFLSGSAGALGGLAISGAFATPAFANEHGEPATEEMPEEMPEDEFDDDIEILNFARTLELLEFRFYEQGLNNISEGELVGSELLQNFGDPITDTVYERLETIRDHEEIHADTLGAVVQDLGGEPVDEPEFEFGTAVEVPEEFIATAVQLEDTGVSAYAGAAPFIQNEDLVPSALSIHSVEARHASYLRVLDQQVPFPDAFDEARSRSEVLDIAAEFIVDDVDEMMPDNHEMDKHNGNGQKNY